MGLIIGFFLPAGLGHAPNIHKGYNHYSAAVPIGFTAFFLRAVLYNVMLGVKIGDVSAIPGFNPKGAEFFYGCNIFAVVVFGGCIPDGLQGEGLLEFDEGLRSRCQLQHQIRQCTVFDECGCVRPDDRCLL